MSATATVPARRAFDVLILADGVTLQGDITLPEGAHGLVIFAHGSGSSRMSPRNRQVARDLNSAGLATLLLDLLTLQEEQVDRLTASHRFDIGLLARRLTGAIDWSTKKPYLDRLPIGLFGASTGAAAALVAAAERPGVVRAVVSRGGRPDLAGAALGKVRAPTLLLVGGFDEVVIDLNREAMASMRCEVALEIVPGATHLFSEPGTLELVSEHAATWFVRHLTTESP
jgi:dienelactone hydrolase